MEGDERCDQAHGRGAPREGDGEAHAPPHLQGRQQGRDQRRYKDSWLALLDHADELRAFIKANEHRLAKGKGEEDE